MSKDDEKKQEEQKNLNFQLFGDRVLIRRERKDEMTKGGLHLPRSAQRQKSRGVVVLIGPDCCLTNKREEVKDHKPLEVGDVVVTPAYGGGEMEMDGWPDDKFLCLPEGEIIGKVLDPRFDQEGDEEPCQNSSSSSSQPNGDKFVTSKIELPSEQKL